MNITKYFILNTLLLFASLNLNASTDSPYKDIPEYSTEKILSVELGHPVQGAVSIGDKIYAAKIASTRGYIELIEYSTNKETGEIEKKTNKIEPTKAYTITNGGVYQDAEVVVWDNSLCFFWKNNTNGDIYMKRCTFDKSNNIVIPSKGVLICNQSTYQNFAATTYKNYLCVLYHSRQDKKIHIAYTSETNAENWEKDWGTVKDGANDNITIDGSTSIYTNSITNLNDAWDATNWVGKRNGKDGEMLIVTRVKGKDNQFEAYTYEGDFDTDTNKTWNPYAHCSGAIDQCFYIKGIQAAVESFTDTDTNPLQFIYSTKKKGTKGEVWLKEFYPATLSFPEDKHNFISMPYGFFGVTVTNIPKKGGDHTNEGMPYTLYQQKLHIVGMSAHNNFYEYHTIMNSYVNRVAYDTYDVSHTHNDEKPLPQDKSLRSFIKLIGIVEGPPPTLVNTKEIYDAIKDELGASWRASSLSVSGSETSVITDSEISGSTINRNIENKRDHFLKKFGMSQQFKTTMTESNKITKSTQFTFESSSVSNNNAFALLMFPTIRKTELTVYLNGVENKNIGSRAGYIITDETITSVPFSLSGNPSNISDPNNLFEWSNRAILSNARNIPSENIIRLLYKVGGGIAKEGLTTEITNSSSSTWQIGKESTNSIPFFHTSSTNFFGGTTTNNTTFDKNLTVTINRIPGELFPSDTYNTYQLNLYVLTDGNLEATKDYYKKMKGVKVHILGSDVDLFTETDGTPFILAWGTGSILNDNISQSSSAAENLSSDKCKINTVSDGIEINCPATSLLEVFSMTGSLIKSANVTNGTCISLPNGVFVVKLISNGEVHIQKIIL